MRLKMNSGHAHQVYGKIVKANEEFEVPDGEGHTWIKLGRATEVKEESTPERRTKRYSRSDLRAENE